MDTTEICPHPAKLDGDILRGIGVGTLIATALAAVIIPDALNISELTENSGRWRDFVLLGAGLVSITVTCLYAIIAILIRYRRWRAPTALRESEVRAIQRATEELEFGQVREPNRLHFDKLLCHCGDSIATATHLYTSATKSAAWSSTYLASTREEFDVRGTWVEIVCDIVGLHIKEQQLGPRPSGSGPSAGLAIREWEGAIELLSILWFEITSRIVAFEALQRAVIELDHELSYSLAASRAEEVARDLIEITTLHKIQSDDSTHRIPDRVNSVTIAIRELVEISTGQVETLKAFAPKSYDKA
ncbi:hypothetical protein [Nocardia rhizosphaerae]|uniref:Uncharacterized protein n=1 Tax=Nocardia rhizosphaerae TaxID=1691571 RepID=A0ABV8L7I5_9NOCA